MYAAAKRLKINRTTRNLQNSPTADTESVCYDKNIRKPRGVGGISNTQGGPLRSTMPGIKGTDGVTDHPSYFPTFMHAALLSCAPLPSRTSSFLRYLKGIRLHHMSRARLGQPSSTPPKSSSPCGFCDQPWCCSANYIVVHRETMNRWTWERKLCTPKKNCAAVLIPLLSRGKHEH